MDSTLGSVQSLVRDVRSLELQFPATAFRFMNLPPEIRLMIYKDLLVAKRSRFLRCPVELYELKVKYWKVLCAMPYNDDHPAMKPKFTRIYRLHTAILGTSKAVYAEALPVLYENNTIYHCHKELADLSENSSEGPPEDLPENFESLVDRKRLFGHPRLSMMRHISIHYYHPGLFKAYKRVRSSVYRRRIGDTPKEGLLQLRDGLKTLQQHATSLQTFTLSIPVFPSPSDDSTTRSRHWHPILHGPIVHALADLYNSGLKSMAMLSVADKHVLENYVRQMLPNNTWVGTTYEKWPGALIQPTVELPMIYGSEYEMSMTASEGKAIWKFETNDKSWRFTEI